jgi:hypothetical protein
VTAAGNRASTIMILALAVSLRLPLVFSGLPYISYIDGGGVLHRVMRFVRSNGWDPGWYQYPSLSMYLTAAVLAQAHDYTTFGTTHSLFGQALDPEELGWLLTLLIFARLAPAGSGTP